ncbi:DNA metabolism protein [Lelliottia amnigena]|nr:DNA metabolism protein [Lelliottia amnigena]PEG66764.1 DNA metabolism protein [Lelliottia amnigena]
MECRQNAYFFPYATSLFHKAILLAILNLGSARNPHVLRVRSGCCALSVFKLSAPITPSG